MTNAKKIKSRAPVSTADRVAAHVARHSELPELPRPRDPERRKRCESSLLDFCREYKPATFSRPISAEAAAQIHRIQHAIEHGGALCMAWPRGWGKTTVARTAIEWAAMYGKRRYIVLVAATQKAAQDVLKKVTRELEGNERYVQDFPEVCRPIIALRGKAQRATSQTYRGEPTKIEYKTDRVAFAMIPGSPSAGVTIAAHGLVGSIRGLSYIDEQCRTIRPDFVFLDDPQTRKSAKSPTQTRERFDLVNGDIIPLAGHEGNGIALVAAVTIIYRGDLADMLLDRERSPAFHSERRSLVISWPTHKAHWDAYADLWRDDRRAGLGNAPNATEYYRANREAMDAGAVMLDASLYDSNELSAVQHAVNLRLTIGDESFAAEYQNAPLEQTTTVYELTPGMVASRVNGLEKHEIDRDAVMLTAFADIGLERLHWAICAFRRDLTGFVLDYGTVPRSSRQRICEENAPEQEQRTRLFAAMREWIDYVTGFKFARAGMPIDIRGIGADRGYLPDVVHQVFRYSRVIGIPCVGFSANRYTESGKTIVRTGFQVHLSEDPKRGQYLAQNSDHWRETSQRGFLATPGSPGSLSIFGKNPRQHDEFAQHMTGNLLVEKAIGERGTLFYKWMKRGPDHYHDAVSGCYALASWYLGAAPVAATGDAGHAAAPRHAVRKTPRRKPKVQIEDRI